MPSIHKMSKILQTFIRKDLKLGYKGKKKRKKEKRKRIGSCEKVLKYLIEGPFCGIRDTVILIKKFCKLTHFIQNRSILETPPISKINFGYGPDCKITFLKVLFCERT